MNCHVLILDDEKSIRWVLEKTLTRANATPHLAATPTEAREILAQSPIDMAFIDINLQHESGLDFTREILQAYPSLLVTIMTGQNTMFHTVEAMKSGAYEYVSKPFDIQEIEEILQRGQTQMNNLRNARHSPSQLSRKEEGELLIGRSRLMRDLYKAIGRVAATNLTVLIQGESGTGKELIARSIHQHSERHEAPFIALNCAAIPSELLESELFGHEKGAFTGANDRKRGKLELVGKGTLFLDEIGDMPLKLQAKLLRVLQERQFERVGGNETLQAQMRVIAATHRQLEKLISEQAFRADLFYRLSVFPIQVPPLREHQEDIPLLVEHFLKRGKQELAVGRKSITEDAMEALVQYAWPGNIRELENIVKSLMITTVSAVITRDSLPHNLLRQTPTLDDQGESLEALATRKLAHIVPEFVLQRRENLMDEIMPQVERPLLQILLEETRWNQQRAARILGINRNTLRKKIEVLNIQRQSSASSA
jgi:two-component system nitrogen regulation response regulator GlnG